MTTPNDWMAWLNGGDAENKLSTSGGACMRWVGRRGGRKPAGCTRCSSSQSLPGRSARGARQPERSLRTSRLSACLLQISTNRLNYGQDPASSLPTSSVCVWTRSFWEDCILESAVAAAYLFTRFASHVICCLLQFCCE